MPESSPASWGELHKGCVCPTSTRRCTASSSHHLGMQRWMEDHGCSAAGTREPPPTAPSVPLCFWVVLLSRGNPNQLTSHLLKFIRPSPFHMCVDHFFYWRTFYHTDIQPSEISPSPARAEPALKMFSSPKKALKPSQSTWLPQNSQNVALQDGHACRNGVITESREHNNALPHILWSKANPASALAKQMFSPLWRLLAGSTAHRAFFRGCDGRPRKGRHLPMLSATAKHTEWQVLKCKPGIFLGDFVRHITLLYYYRELSKQPGRKALP